MKRRQIQLAVALKKCKLENSTLSDAALASVLLEERALTEGGFALNPLCCP